MAKLRIVPSVLYPQQKKRRIADPNWIVLWDFNVTDIDSGVNYLANVVRVPIVGPCYARFAAVGPITVNGRRVSVYDAGLGENVQHYDVRYPSVEYYPYGETVLVRKFPSLPGSDVGMCVFGISNNDYTALVSVPVDGIQYLAVITNYVANGGVIRVTNVLVDTDVHVYNIVIADVHTIRVFVDGVEVGWLEGATDTNGDPFDWDNDLTLEPLSFNFYGPEFCDEGGWDQYFPAHLVDFELCPVDTWIGLLGFCDTMTDRQRTKYVNSLLEAFRS